MFRIFFLCMCIYGLAQDELNTLSFGNGDSWVQLDTAFHTSTSAAVDELLTETERAFFFRKDREVIYDPEHIESITKFAKALVYINMYSDVMELKIAGRRVADTFLNQYVTHLVYAYMLLNNDTSVYRVEVNQCAYSELPSHEFCNYTLNMNFGEKTYYCCIKFTSERALILPPTPEELKMQLCEKKKRICPKKLICEHGFEQDEDGCDTCKCICKIMDPANYCRRQCPAGYAKDEQECPTCNCQDVLGNECPRLSETCKKNCSYGFVHDINGCEICQCKHCPPFHCDLHCEYGYIKDSCNCDVCECFDPQKEQLSCEQDRSCPAHLYCDDDGVCSDCKNCRNMEMCLFIPLLDKIIVKDELKTALINEIKKVISRRYGVKRRQIKVDFNDSDLNVFVFKLPSDDLASFLNKIGQFYIEARSGSLQTLIDAHIRHTHPSVADVKVQSDYCQCGIPGSTNKTEICLCGDIIHTEIANHSDPSPYPLIKYKCGLFDFFSRELQRCLAVPDPMGLEFACVFDENIENTDKGNYEILSQIAQKFYLRKHQIKLIRRENYTMHYLILPQTFPFNEEFLTILKEYNEDHKTTKFPPCSTSSYSYLNELRNQESYIDSDHKKSQSRIARFRRFLRRSARRITDMDS